MASRKVNLGFLKKNPSSENNFETETTPSISTTLLASSTNSLIQKKRKALYDTTAKTSVKTQLLKKAFAPKCEKGESYDTYLNLIYGQQCEDGDEEESDSSASDNDEIPSG
ncbi:10534_t:CDS:2, partial [Dentiscutata erythropus]